MENNTSKLFETIDKTMEKLKPIVSEGAKVTSSFAQELVKTCITLNAGGLVAFPTFVRATTPSAVITNPYYYACGSFSAGVLLGAVAMLIGFIGLFRSLRATTYANMLPMLELQDKLIPDTMDKQQRNRLIAAKRASATVERRSIRGVVIFTAFCGFSLAFLIAGGVFGAWALLHSPNATSPVSSL